MKVIEFHQVSKWYGQFQALKSISLTVNKGEIVDNDSIGNLKQSELNYIVQLEFDKSDISDILAHLPSEIRRDRVSDTIWKFSSTSQEDLRKLIFDLAVKNGLTVLSLSRKEENMEDVFRRYTN